MSKQAIFNLIMTVLVVAGLFLAGLYFFGDTRNPNGLRQKIFGAVPKEEPKKQKVVQEPAGEKAEVSKTEEKTEPVAQPDKQETTVVVVENKTEVKVEEKATSELNRDELIDRKLAEMSVKDLKNLRIDTKDYLDFITESTAEHGVRSGHDISEIEKNVPLKDPVITDLAKQYAKVLRASCAMGTLKDNPKLAEEIGMIKCSKCKNQYIYDCPKCKKKEERTLSDHEDQGGFALKGFGKGKKTKAQKEAEQRDKVCSMCGGSKKIACDVCAKRLKNIVNKHRAPLQKEVAAMLKKVGEAYSIKKSGKK